MEDLLEAVAELFFGIFDIVVESKKIRLAVRLIIVAIVCCLIIAVSAYFGMTLLPSNLIGAIFCFGISVVFFIYWICKSIRIYKKTKNRVE